MDGFTAIPCITVAVYLLAEIFKAFTNEKHNKYIPIVCGSLGAIFGIIIHFVAPELIPGKDVFCSLATGIISGFSATGINQVYKQVTDGEKKE